jgi:hypothetical protein
MIKSYPFSWDVLDGMILSPVRIPYCCCRVGRCSAHHRSACCSLKCFLRQVSKRSEKSAKRKCMRISWWESEAIRYTYLKRTRRRYLWPAGEQNSVMYTPGSTCSIQSISILFPLQGNWWANWTLESGDLDTSFPWFSPRWLPNDLDTWPVQVSLTAHSSGALSVILLIWQQKIILKLNYEVTTIPIA